MNRSMEGLQPLDEDVLELLRCEREHGGDPLRADRIDHMWRAVVAELAVIPMGAEASANKPSVSAPSPVLLRVASTKTGSGALRLASLLKGHLVGMAIGLGLGGVGGLIAGGQVELRHRQAVMASTHQQSSTNSPVATPAEPINAEPPRPVPVAVPAAAAAPTRHLLSKGARGSSELATALDGERALVSQAETALRHGDWSEALRQTQAYSKRFPHGNLSEENLYLSIRASLAAGDEAGAGAKMQELRRRYPRSPLVQPGE